MDFKKGIEFLQIRKLPGPQFGIRLWELSRSGGSTVWLIRALVERRVQGS